MGVEGYRVLKVQLPHGLEQLARGAQVQSDVGVLLPAGLGPGGAGDVHAGLHNGLQIKLTLRREFQAVGSEGVSADDVAARLQIGPVEGGDPLRVEQVPGLGQLAPLQALGLEQGAGASVEKQAFPP